MLLGWCVLAADAWGRPEGLSSAKSFALFLPAGL